MSNKTTFIEFLLNEAKVRRDDPAMADYYDQMADPETPSEPHQSGYAVGYDSGFREWYGDGPPGRGPGRYKNKVAGGVLAINVPTYEMAEKIAKEIEYNEELERQHQEERDQDYDEAPYTIPEYFDVWVKSMSELDEYELSDIERGEAGGRVRDYSNVNEGNRLLHTEINRAHSDSKRNRRKFKELVKKRTGLTSQGLKNPDIADHIKTLKFDD